MRINDPVFKNRIVIGNEELPNRNWIWLIIILIVTIIGAVVYLYPVDINKKVKPEPEPKVILEPQIPIPKVVEKTEIVVDLLNNEEQLSDEVKTLLKKAQEQIKRGRLSNSKTNSAYVIYKKLVRLAPNSTTVQNLLNDIINSLFTRAERQMSKQKYTTPINNNALNTYQKILKITPDNTKAQNGIIEIANIYYKLALKKQQQKKYKSSLFWIEKGLQVVPDDSNLNQLKQKLTEHIEP
jgi:tetratricopeptide (TPR) repeat protein